MNDIFDKILYSNIGSGRDEDELPLDTGSYAFNIYAWRIIGLIAWILFSGLALHTLITLIQSVNYNSFFYFFVGTFEYILLLSLGPIIYSKYSDKILESPLEVRASLLPIFLSYYYLFWFLAIPIFNLAGN